MIDIPTAVQLARTERRIAEAAVVSDIESFGLAVNGMGRRVYDVRALTDQREHSPGEIDMMRQALSYAHWRGLTQTLQRLPDGTPTIVRIVRNPE